MISAWFGPLRRYCIVLLAIGGFACVAGTQKVNIACHADMPSVDRVKAAVQDTDPTDTLARQVAVLTDLSRHIESPAEYKALITNPPNPGR